MTTLFLTTSLFNALVDADVWIFAGVKTLLTGGERCSVSHFNRLREAHPALRLVHVYGPTENTTFTSFHPVAQVGVERDVPIGQPISNTCIYILDENLEPLPIGVPGELYTGGEGVARGYLGRPGLTAERFVPDPFSGREGARLYRSGDLARWKPDGTIEFLGRVDEQLKVRGYRIEPGEIEAALRSRARVKEALVVACEEEGAAQGKRLIGYVVMDKEGGEKPTLEELREFLAGTLPGYMAPALLIELNALPLNRNGKVDRAALPRPGAIDKPARGENQAPRNAAEAVLASIWRELLQREHIGIDDNYFALGGDSISAIQLVSRLRKEGWQLAIREIFQRPTIALLAPQLRRAETEAPRRSLREGPVPLTAIQRWFFEHHDEELHHFNQAVLLQSRTRLEAVALRGALEALQKHHDALRMTYRSGEGKVEQIAHGDVAVELSIADLRGASDESAMLEAHAAAVQAGICLETGPLMKAAIYRLTGCDCLLIAIHHLAVDGVSWRILLEDLETAYRQRLDGLTVDLGARTDCFARWSELQQEAAEHPSLLAELDYWRAELEKPATPLPRDAEAVENCFGDSAVAEMIFSEPETRLLLSEVHHAYTTDLQDLLLTALDRALRRWHGGGATRITLEGHGREPLHAELDLSRTVGWFTSLFPFVLEAGEGGPGERLKRVKESFRALPRKGAGFGILRHLGRDEVRHALDSAEMPRLSFNYLGQFAETDRGDEAGGLFAFAGHSVGSAIGARVRRAHDVDVTGIISRGRLALSAHFVAGRHRRETIERFLAHYREELLALAAHCRARAEPEKTPADFTARLFTLSDYEAFLKSYGWKAAAIDDIYPLSPMQEGLLFESAYDEASKAYFVQMSMRLRGELVVECFVESWRELCRRHEILRTAFVHENVPRSLQVVLRERPPVIVVADLRGLPSADQQARIRQHEQADIAQPFALDRDPLVRIAVFRLADALNQVVWSYHHIVLDGWSLGIVHRELMEFYGGLLAGSPARARPKCRYAEYIQWFERRDREASRRYWSQYLSGVDGVTTVPRPLGVGAAGGLSTISGRN